MSTPDYAELEKQAAARINLSSYQWFLVGAVVTFLVGLFLFHSGDVRGYQVLFFSDAASQARIKIAEYIFVFIASIATVIFAGLTLITRRMICAYFAWLLGGIAMLVSLLGIWMRIQSHAVDGDPGLGIGFIVEVIAVIVMIYALSCTIFARSEDQLRAQEERLHNEKMDAVGQAQQAVFTSRDYLDPETNPLLIDDCRRQAALRRKNKPDLTQS
ncbi:hypothetical protein UL82_06220 [Corynebacterium kutscheri]|uniref:Uncharacterized protein n=1 Tax=Corynebacterium kutscheri TaxID=35755 RepID=A0A0F6R0P7_9CORY|nr:hypothetical protein [Corynebacterium kutscheri]AKE41410.1 hypothetical protein UL82_06220 [Corynebacterium kutscheri]VEH09734.1 hypothetical membrane protein [Corynebacterium kutscheri]